jgi:N4-gp56 family major capsid protein
MADTRVPADAQVIRWSNDYFKEYTNRNFFRKFESTGSDNVIVVKEDLSAKVGGSIVCHLVNRLKSKAKNWTDTLDGNEQELKIRTHTTTIREYSEVVKWKNFMEQLTEIDMLNVHKETLMKWSMDLDRDNVIESLGSIDSVPYDAATEPQKDTWLANNADRVLFGAATSNNAGNDHSSSLANIDSTADKFSADAVSLMKRLAKAADPKIMPLRVKSSIGDSDMYVAFVNSRAFRDIRKDSEFVQANREARERGVDNPVFSGANLIYDNVAIYEIEDIPVYKGVGNGGIDVSPVYLCGAQALVKAWAKRPTMKTRNDLNWYGSSGVVIRQWYKIEKLRWGTGAEDHENPKDHGIVTGYFAAVAD